MFNDFTRVHALFSTRDAWNGSISFQANNDKQLHLSILHERADGSVKSYDFAGNEELIAVPVQDAEALIIIARRSGAIVASGVFEVNQELAENGLLLVPRVLGNLALYQESVPFRVTTPLLDAEEVAR